MAQTRVQALREALWHADFKTLKELSAELRLAEKEIPELLEKLSHTLKHEAKRLQVDPARCIACSFEFNARERFSRPSRCPACRSERIAPARVRIPE
jgi:transcriptional regulator